MSEESIFHKLIKGENAYTQLLRNVMVRDDGFRGGLLDLFDERLKDWVNPGHVRTQVPLPRCGQADILIRSPRLSMIVEAKTETHRTVTDKQRLLDNPASYQSWLEMEKANGSEAWLVFLVPASWKYRDDKEDEITAYKKRFNQRGILTKQIFWEDLLPLLIKSANQKELSLVHEFRLVLEERFGPVRFDREEAAAVFSDNFPVSTMLKLIAVIDKIGQENIRKPSKLDITKEEFGWYFTKRGEETSCWLYFGCWLDFWNDNHHPICFGVSDVSPAIKKQFVSSLKEIYKQDPIQCGDYLMGYIPEEDLAKSSAVEEISPKIKRLWKSMSEVAG
jgi:hypothetical protein